MSCLIDYVLIVKTEEQVITWFVYSAYLEASHIFDADGRTYCEVVANADRIALCSSSSCSAACSFCPALKAATAMSASP